MFGNWIPNPLFRDSARDRPQKEAPDRLVECLIRDVAHDADAKIVSLLSWCCCKLRRCNDVVLVN
jgi:hypothetical protein